MAQQPLVGQSFLIIEASRSHTDTSHSVGLLWTSDQLVAETSTWQHTKEISMPPAGFFFPVPFVPFIHFVPLNPSLLLHVTYIPYYRPYNKHNTNIHAPGGILFSFFFCLSGVFPLWSIFVLFKSFRPACHFTFHTTVLTTNTTQTSMPPTGFEPTIPVSERPQTHALDRTAIAIDCLR
jgi:hypothetical protein